MSAARYRECPCGRDWSVCFMRLHSHCRVYCGAGRTRACTNHYVSLPPGPAVGDSQVTVALRNAFADHGIEFVPDFPINRVTAGAVTTSDGRGMNFNLLMLVPPFQGSPAVLHLGISNQAYINVDSTMRVVGAERMFAVGDCVNFSGPKMGHMAVRQAEVAAAIWQQRSTDIRLFTLQS